MSGLHYTLHIQIRFYRKRVREGERTWMQIFIDAGLNLVAALARQSKPSIRHLRLHLQERNARIAGSGNFGKFFQFLSLARMGPTIAYQNHTARAVHPGVAGLTPELGVLGVDLACENTLVVELLRLVAQDERNLAVYVDALIVIVVVLGSCDAVANEDH